MIRFIKIIHLTFTKVYAILTKRETTRREFLCMKSNPAAFDHAPPTRVRATPDSASLLESLRIKGEIYHDQS